MRTVRTPIVVLALAVVASIAACKKDAPKENGAGTASGTAAGTASGTAAGTASGTAAGTGAGTTTAPAGDAATAPATATLARPFFYRIEKDGKTGHILGTMHLGVEPERLPPVVWQQLDAAKAFAMETNIMDPSLIGALMRDDGKTLSDELGPEYWKKLQAALPDMADNLDKMKASAAATLLQAKDLPMTQSMDMVLLMRARKNGAEIVFLEAAQLQQALVDRWLDAKMLKAMLDDQDEAAAKSKELLDTYVGGDEDKLTALSFDKSSWHKTGRPDAEFDQMMKEMLYDRNASWIAPIEKMMAQGDAFVAVGAAHLAGKGSVLELLRERGYTVTRVSP